MMKPKILPQKPSHDMTLLLAMDMQRLVIYSLENLTSTECRPEMREMRAVP